MVITEGKFKKVNRVLVTGASGFIGSHVVENLVKAGFSVTGLVHYNGRADHGWLKFLDPEIKDSINIVLGDITDSEYMNKIVSNNDLTINLAALIAIPYSYTAPRSYLNINLLGTLNICEAVKSNNSELIHFSTSEVYGTPNSVPITLNHAINPQSPYAASKASADFLCTSYFKSFGLKVRILRPFNTYGPRQSMRAIIPTIINQFISNNGVINIGNLTPKRDFTFVQDTAEAVTLLALSDTPYGEVIQLGTGSAYSVKELIDMCEKISGVKAKIKSDKERLRPLASEVEVLLSDPASANKSLGWNHKVGLEAGLISTYHWFRENQSNIADSGRYFV
jgi:UDP-glucose 4-epimerase